MSEIQRVSLEDVEVLNNKPLLKDTKVVLVVEMARNGSNITFISRKAKLELSEDLFLYKYLNEKVIGYASKNINKQAFINGFVACLIFCLIIYWVFL